MIFEVSGLELLSAVQKLGSLFAAGRSNLVSIDASNGDIIEVVYTNDLNILKIELYGTVIEPGKVILSADFLVSSLRTFKKSQDLMFSFETVEDICVITSGVVLDGGVSTRVFKCECYDSVSFPSIVIDNSKMICELNPSSVFNLIKHIPRAVNLEETRSELRGIRCFFDRDKLTFASTNGILILEGMCFVDCSDVLEVIVNRDLFVAFMSIFKAEEVCRISISDNFITFHSDDTYLSGLLISGTYPNYSSYFDDLDFYFEISKQDLLDNLISVLPAAVKEDYYRVIFSIESGLLKFDAGKAISEYSFDLKLDSRLEIHLDGYLLKTALDACVTDKVVFGCKIAKDSMSSSYVVVKNDRQRMLVVGFRKQF